ncbi:MAG: hypothetical protein M3O70_13090, partial [Actinomycetota bacterium]|nr:hypothetical protein [Actinomycetota bacterium]
MRTRAPRSPFVFVVAALAALLVGCSSGEPQVEAGGLPSFAEESSASPTTSPLADAGNPPAPGAEDDEAPPAPADPDRGQKLPFPADTKPDVSSAQHQQGFPVLVAVTKGTHPGYVRYVFEFASNHPEGHSPLVA